MKRAFTQYEAEQRHTPNSPSQATLTALNHTDDEMLVGSPSKRVKGPAEESVEVGSTNHAFPRNSLPSLSTNGFTKKLDLLPKEQVVRLLLDSLMTMGYEYVLDLIAVGCICSSRSPLLQLFSLYFNTILNVVSKLFVLVCEVKSADSEFALAFLLPLTPELPPKPSKRSLRSHLSLSTSENSSREYYKENGIRYVQCKLEQ